MSSQLTDDGPTSTGVAGSVVRHAIVRFTVWSVIALIVISIATVFISQRLARDEALRDARVRAAGIARGIAVLVTQSLRTGDQQAVARVSSIMTPRLSGGALTHVKLWAQDGTIIWADEPTLVGQQFDLEEDVASLFGTTNVTAELSDLSEAENAAERREGELLEVYVGTYDSTQRPIVFEAYLSTDRMEEKEKELIAQLLPLSLGGLLLFQIAVLPLAVSLARRVDRAQQERAKVLRHGLLASDLERRRIAQDLHDGVIQDLAGLGFAMPIVAEQLPSGPEAADAREAVAHVSMVLSRDVTALRSLLTDIYPPNLEGEGLVAAVEELAMRAEDAQVSVSVEVSPDFHAPLDATRLAYRVVREGLRNVLRHARASAAQVHLLRNGDDIVVRVVDDGRGVDENTVTAPGHLGLRLLADTVQDLGGRLDLSPGARGGAILEAVFPADLIKT
ncbi:MAG TPA: histidine kinase [Nocardioidaceae bacterium]|nr:histidine kinase [Nocardioidaceae bacterium]